MYGEEMVDLLSGKMKRKGAEELSGFSLSSPARKIRRLNVELLPIIERDEPIAHTVSNSQLPHGHLQGIHEDISTNVMEEMPSSFVNEERALILYKPLRTPHLMQPQNLSNLSVKVNANLVPRFQDQGFWKVRAEQTEKSDAINNSLAVVPWVPSNVQLGMIKESDFTNPSFEPMEADEELATMEVEEETGDVGGEMDFANVNDIVGAGVNRVDNLRQQQWQQQHCMIPNIPLPKSSIPITWSW